jgi:type VI protein secretion system component Hcp
LRKYFVFVIGLLSVGGAPVTAQFTPTAVLSSATLNLDGCSTLSQVNAWSWGESNPTTAGSGGLTTGKVDIASLAVQKTLDKCSPLLATDAATGGHFATATLTEYDVNNKVLMTMVLTEVFVEDYSIAGSTSGAGPTESVSLRMEKVQINYPTPSGNIPFCWDNVALKSC